MDTITRRPDLYLKGMQEKVIKSNEETLILANKLENIVKQNITDEGAILFSNETFNIPAMRYAPCVPQPHWFITGMRFIASIQHNNSFTKQSHLSTVLVVQLLIEVDSRSSQYNISDDQVAEVNNLFTVHPKRLIFKEEEHESVKYGIIERPHNGSWDTEILVKDFKDFLKLKGIFDYACKKIGLI